MRRREQLQPPATHDVELVWHDALDAQRAELVLRWLKKIVDRHRQSGEPGSR